MNEQFIPKEDIPRIFKPEEDIPRIYKELYRKGVTKQDAIAFLAFILRRSFTIKDQYLEDSLDYVNDEIIDDFKTKTILDIFYSELEILNTINENKFLDKNLIKKELRKLIVEWSEEVIPEKKITPENIVKIMQSIAKNLSKNIKDTKFIDLAVGTGSLLENLQGNVTGFDIDGKSIYISGGYLYFSNEYDIDTLQRDVITNFKGIFEYSSELSIFLFDPPMGDSRDIPFIWKGKNYAEIIGEKTTKLSSELLFLVNYLLYKHKNSYCIGLFPSSILFKSSKEYTSLREYIIEKFLCMIIEVSYSNSTGKIILVGTNDKEKLKDNVPIVNLTKEISNEELNDFIEDILDEKNSSEEHLKKYESFAMIKFNNRPDLSKSNTIETPKKSIETKKLDPPEDIISRISNIEDELKSEILNLMPFIKTTSKENVVIEEKKDDLTIWIQENEISDDIKIILENKSFISKTEKEKIYNYIFYKNNDQNMYDYIDGIKLLFESNLLSEDYENFFEIDLDKYNNEKNSNDFSEFFHPKKFDKNIEKALALLPEKQNEVYEKIYKAWLNKEEIDLVYSKDYLAISVLKDFCLIIEKNEKDNDFCIQIRNKAIRPFHPVLDGI